MAARVSQVFLEYLIIEAEIQESTGGVEFGDEATATLSIPVSAESSVSFSVLAVNGELVEEDASPGLSIGVSASATVIVPVSATTAISFSGSASETTDISVSGSASTQITIATSASPNVQPPSSSGLGFGVTAEATLLAPAPPAAPGSSAYGLAGMRTMIRSGVDPEFPFTWTDTPNGDVLFCNGVDPMFKWRWLRATAEKAGLPGPEAAVTGAASGTGKISGSYYAFVRFVGRDGNVSNFGPVSNEIDAGTSGTVSGVTRVTPENDSAATVLDDATKLRFASADHGLAVNDTIFLQGLATSGINGLDGDTPYLIAAKTDDTFDVNVTGVDGTYAGGVSWVSGSDTISYSDIPTTADPRVAKKQILRSASGSYQVFYVDVELDDLSATSASSTKSDEDLLALQGVPLFYGNDRPFANRHHVPPSHKRAIASHLGRVFAASEVDYESGHLYGASNATTVQGFGTNWKESFAGRKLYIDGDSAEYEIEEVDEGAQTLTLTSGLAKATSVASRYAIRSDAIERRLVYYTEAGLPESWPPYNVFSVQEDGDEITGLFTMGAWLFIAERHHLYRFTYQTDPLDDGAVFLSSNRGCVNPRCVVVSDDAAYLLDSDGVHRFDGGESESVSGPIRDVFKADRGPGLRVNWNADQTLWHAAHDPTNDTIRWFVSMSGHREPRHALCFEYRQDRWWIEEYPFVVTSSTVASIGSRRSFVGTAGRRVMWIGGDSPAEVALESDCHRGTASSSSPTSLTDTAARFASSMIGAPVSIVSGKGRDQRRRIVGVPSLHRIEVDRPWLDAPDATSVYQIGGVSYEFKGHWYRYVEDDESRTRNVELVFQPLLTTTTVADMRLYFDFAAEPHEWDYTGERYGASVEDGSSSILMDLTRQNGIATFHNEGHREVDVDGQRFVSVAITGTAGPERVAFRQLRIHGVY